MTSELPIEVQNLLQGAKMSIPYEVREQIQSGWAKMPTDLQEDALKELMAIQDPLHRLLLLFHKCMMALHDW